jgi:bifunctional enzyme CysN/CysC
LLFDTNRIYDDQLAAIKTDSQKYGTTNEDMDLALLVDGLKAEREQGITIDVAYRYFSTDKRHFIIADTPGHEQYTRNMATGASGCDLTLVLIDARKGVLIQTRRHAYISALLGIKNAVFVINKMDLIDWDFKHFDAIRQDCIALATILQIPNTHVVPVSSIGGDNIVNKSQKMPWYDGPTVMQILETTEIRSKHEHMALRVPIQYINRPHQDFRGFCGTVASGELRVGESVMVLPSRQISTIKSLVTYDGNLESASTGQALTITLTDEIDINRGDVIVHPEKAAGIGKDFEATVIWMSEIPMLSGKQYLFRLHTKICAGVIEEIVSRTDLGSFEKQETDSLQLNEIGLCKISLAEPVAFDRYKDLSATGGFIIIDRFTFNTVGAGLIERGIQEDIADKAKNVLWHDQKVTKYQRAALKGQKPCIIWFTGLSGSGKSTLANLLEQKLNILGYHSYLLDGDNTRHGLNRDLDFSDTGRSENIRRVGEVAKLFVDAGIIVITAFISPFRGDRQMVRGLVERDEFIEVYLDTPIEVCENRDTKGLYAKARIGLIKDFTGIDSPYEAPIDPELVLNTDQSSIQECLDFLLKYLEKTAVLVNQH